MSDSQVKKDLLVTFKAVKQVVSKKGAPGLQLSMSQEQAQLMLSELSSKVDNERGVKISVYYPTKQTDDGKEFLGGFAFVSEIQEFGTQRVGGFGGARVVAKKASQTVSPETESKIKKLKTELQ